MAYPTTIDSLTNPTAGDKTNVVDHAANHSNANDAIEAVQVKVGVDNSAVIDSIDYKLTNASSSNPGHKHTLAIGATDVTVAAAEVVGETDTQTLTNKTIDADNNTILNLVSPPTASITMYSASSAPTGWLLCQGQAVNRTTYSALFALVGTDYGVGDGSTTFNLPDLQGNIPVGLKSADADFDALGETGGAKTHQLTEAEMPSHLHTVNPPSTASSSNGGHTHNNYQVAAFTGGGGTGLNDTNSGTQVLAMTSAGAHTHTTNIAQFNSGSKGSDTAHTIVQPYIVLNYIIKT